MKARLVGGALLATLRCLPAGDDLGAYSAEWSPAGIAGVAASAGGATASSSAAGTATGGSAGVVAGGSIPPGGRGGSGALDAAGAGGGAGAGPNGAGAGSGGAGGDDDPDGSCASGVLSPDGSRCYIVSSSAAAWEDARDECVILGAVLVKVESEAEDALLGALLPESQWLGGSDTEIENVFVWTDGSPMDGFGNWGPNQPDRYPGPDCIEKRASAGGQWFDQPCFNERAFVCERPSQP